MKLENCYVGQIIRGKKESIYSRTTDKAEMEVKKVHYNEISVKIVNHKKFSQYIGETHIVHPEYFIPLNNSIKKL